MRSNLVLSIKILSAVILKSFWTLVEFKACGMLLVMIPCFFCLQLFSLRQSVFPQIINLDFGLYTYFSHIYYILSWIRSPEAALYKLKISRLAVSVSSWISQMSRSCPLHCWQISVLLKHWSFLTKIHNSPPPPCCFF
jgi:hypothetical protein